MDRLQIAEFKAAVTARPAETEDADEDALDAASNAVVDLVRAARRTRIGAAWSHAQGGGFNVDLHALPIDGRIVLMPPRDEAGGGPEGGV